MPKLPKSKRLTVAEMERFKAIIKENAAPVKDGKITAIVAPRHSSNTLDALPPRKVPSACSHHFPSEICPRRLTIAEEARRVRNEGVEAIRAHNHKMATLTQSHPLKMFGTKCAVSFEPLPSSSGHILLPENPRLREMNGKQAAAIVVAVGAKSKHPDLKPGVRVSVRWGAGNLFEHAGETLHVIDEEEIQALI